MPNHFFRAALSWLRDQFESARGGVGGNLQAMEGLRGFAVFLVFIVHYISMTEPWIVEGTASSAILKAVHTIGNAGVDLFFILSGYLIYGSLIQREQPFLPYLWRRIIRIYPTFTVVFLAYVALSFAMPSQSKIPAGMFNALIYLLQNFLLLPGLFPIEPMITVAWSLSYELFYYIAIPVILWAFALRKKSPAQRILFFASIALLGAIYCGQHGGPIRLIMFISGILLYETIANKLLPNPSSLIALIALIAGLASTLLPLTGTSGYAIRICILFACFFAVCLSCFAAPHKRFAKAFTWAPIRWLGNMSYSYYLLHGLALKATFLILHAAIKDPQNGLTLTLAFLPVVFVMTLVPSAILFIAIERPFSITKKAAKSATNSKALYANT